MDFYKLYFLLCTFFINFNKKPLSTKYFLLNIIITFLKVLVDRTTNH